MKTTSERQLYPADTRNPDNSADKQIAYVQRLAGMDAVALRKEAESMIWLSAFANNNPRSCYHWQCDAVYDECKRRGSGVIYDEAHKSVRASL